MKQNLNIFSLIILCFIMNNIIIAQDWSAPKDANGWTILTPSADSRIIYVSNEGNDATAQTYTTVEVGNDPGNPTISILPYRNLSTALNQMRDGYPDWILLERGDTFTNYNINFGEKHTGRSSFERAVYTYYGSTGSRPVLKNPIVAIIGCPENAMNNRAFIGLEFYDSEADFDSPDFIAGSHVSGFSTSTGGTNILFEDCKFNFFFLILQAVDGPYVNLEVRRNIFTDGYGAVSCTDAQGASPLFITGAQNYLLEENFVDYPGWHPRIPASGRNQFDHGFYLQNDCSGELICRANIVTRAAGNSIQNRSGGVAEYNVSVQCPAGFFVDRDDVGGGAAAGITRVRYNLVLDGLNMGNCSESSGANWGLTLGSRLESGTIVEENIISGNLNYNSNLALNNDSPGSTLLNNIVYGWNDSEDMWDDSWTDPDRDIASYYSSIGAGSSLEDYIADQRNRSVNEWPEELSAYSLINYIREGFGLSSIVTATSSESNKPAEFKLFQNYPNPFNPETTIKYSIPILPCLPAGTAASSPLVKGSTEVGFVSLKVYNLLGEEVTTLVNEQQPAGTYKVTFDAGNLGSGVYFYQLKVGNKFNKTGKMVVMK